MNTEKATNLIDMRTSNALLILNIIRKAPCSRASIAKMTGLSRSAVTIIIDHLMQQGMVEETQTSQNGTGRKALDLKICKNAGYTIGVHLRSQMYTIGVFNLEGELLQAESNDYHKDFLPEAQLESIGSHIVQLIQSQGIEAKKVLGVGICASGPVDVQAGKVIRSSSVWHEVEICQRLSSLLHWNCFLENRSNARAVYEKLYGKCKEYSSFIFFKVDESVGGAIVYKDEVLSGYRRFGNEFGHISIKHDGKRCECGNFGCLDMYASIPAILKQFPQIAGDSWKSIVDEAYDGNPVAIQAIKQEADYISTGIVKLCYIFEPEAIALAGDITYRPNLLMALISEDVSERHILREVFNSKIILADQIDHINLRSAAALVVEEFYQGKINFI